jgi:hypothetical protein
MMVIVTEEVVTHIKHAAVGTGLVINESKTKYLKINRNITDLEEDLRMVGQVLESVQNFRYLGALIN